MVSSYVFRRCFFAKPDDYVFSKKTFLNLFTLTYQ